MWKILGSRHERIPVKTPNMIAHIEALHSILEDECYSRHEFGSLAEAYATAAEYMRYYSYRRRHGAMGYAPPESPHEKFIRKIVPARAFPHKLRNWGAGALHGTAGKAANA